MSMQGVSNSEIRFQADDVLVKTDKGIHESRVQTSESALPRQLRTLLLAVDGKSPFRVYARTLENYGDVQAIYGKLKAGGYVQCSHELDEDGDAAPLLSRLGKLRGWSLKSAS